VQSQVVTRGMKTAWILAAVAALTVSGAFATFAIGLDRMVLWQVVRACVADFKLTGTPFPCLEVDLSDGEERGAVVLRPPLSDDTILAPTRRIIGIEDPFLQSPGAPNYFDAAWRARTFLKGADGRAPERDAIALIVNSAAVRGQDQLHIHVDCIQPDVHQALREREASIGNRWAPLDVYFSGHRYEAMWVPGERLGSNNPFRLLAEGIPGAAQDMGDRTLVVVGSFRANGAAGFIILEDQVSRESHDSGYGEELLDHACRIAPAAQSKN